MKKKQGFIPTRVAVFNKTVHIPRNAIGNISRKMSEKLFLHRPIPLFSWLDSYASDRS